MREIDEREMLRAADAVRRALRKVDNPGIAMAALLRVIFDLALTFPPEEREWVIQGAIQVLRDVSHSTKQHFPEEFGTPTRQ